MKDVSVLEIDNVELHKFKKKKRIFTKIRRVGIKIASLLYSQCMFLWENSIAINFVIFYRGNKSISYYYYCL